MTRPIGADLAPLFGPPPAEAAQDVRYRQGVVIDFDPVTLANTVLVGGAVMTDLPILGVGEATLLAPGSVVGVLVIGSGGATSMAIIGRLVVPSTDDAANAVSLLNSLVYAATIQVQETRTGVGTTFGDLATVGPSVTVPVRASGRLLVIVTSQIQWIATFAASPAAGGWVTVEMSGANTVSTAAANDIILPAFYLAPSMSATPPTIAMAAQVSATAAAVFSGLTPGNTTVTMKYARQIAAQAVDFGRRTVVAITL